jgi:hypothetical protein
MQGEKLNIGRCKENDKRRSKEIRGEIRREAGRKVMREDKGRRSGEKQSKLRGEAE